jgi:hypothetical protein
MGAPVSTASDADSVATLRHLEQRPDRRRAVGHPREHCRFSDSPRLPARPRRHRPRAAAMHVSELEVRDSLRKFWEKGGIRPKKFL